MTGYRGLLVACALIGASPSVLAQGASNNPLERAYFAQKRGEPTPEALELASRYVEGRAGALRIPDVATFTLSLLVHAAEPGIIDEPGYRWRRETYAEPEWADLDRRSRPA